MKEMISISTFLKKNLHPYDGDAGFLVGPTDRTIKIWKICQGLLKKETEAGGVLGIDAEKASSITSHKPGYIQKELELIVGLQTEQPLVRAIKPAGGIGVVRKACQENGVVINSQVEDFFSNQRKTHNQAVFDAYTEEMRTLRRTGVLTGLPDSYGRGRIICDYRRLAYYGVDQLITQKEQDKVAINSTDDTAIRLREELAEQIKSLTLLKEMAASYGVDISQPAQNAQQAIQWIYFGYLAAAKEQDGAAISLGSVSGFIDVYIERDLENGVLKTEAQAQELIDQFVIKLRLIRQLRTQDYMELFAGDPTWITESLGGSWSNGQHKVTKTAYRFLQTLYNLGSSPEPNLTVLWSKNLPTSFKQFCAKTSIETSSIQYENDDLMRMVGRSDDYGISCCVSRLTLGSQMQYFGARCNIAKALLLALNEGKDEVSGVDVLSNIKPIKKPYLEYEEVWKNYQKTLQYLAKKYVDTLNIIHFMHDKYYYERVQMALLDTNLERLMAFGVAGLSVAVDSLSAIKYAKVKAVRNSNGLTEGFVIDGDFPKYGNDDDRVDQIARDILEYFYTELGRHQIYRNARPTLSVLTITSNVVYGKKTGATPDGRLAGEPFAPGANPMHGRESKGVIASLNSVAKLPYEILQDGISNTITFAPQSLGKKSEQRIKNLENLIEGYFAQNGHHLNVNVLDKATLEDAMIHPEKYPQLTLRVSGYAVYFVKLSREQQEEILKRTFFEGGTTVDV